MNSQVDEHLTKFIQYAYSNSKAVKDVFDRAGISPDTVRTISDLEKVPVTSKDSLIKLQQANPPFGGFLAVPLEDLEHIFLSPGPIYEPYAGEDAVLKTFMETSLIAGFKAKDVVINTFGYHFIPTGLAVDRVLRDIGATVIAAGVGNAEIQIKMMHDLKVTGYVGTPSWLMALLQKIDEMGLNFRENFALKHVLVSAEPLPPSLRQTFVEQYGLSVTNAYGTAELGVLAINKEGGLPMRLLETSIVQIVDPDTGQTVAPGEAGEVVVTSFNTTYPLIRLGTGDLAINMDPAPGISRQGERSIILVGRVGEAVKVRGMFLHPNQLRFAISQVAGISRYQAVVTRPESRDELLLKVVLDDQSADIDKISEYLSKSIQAACRVKIDQFEFLQPDELLDDPKIIVDERLWE